MSRTRLLGLLLTVTLAATPLAAQRGLREVYEWGTSGFAFDFLVPVGPMGQYVDWGGGMDAFYAVNLGPLPIGLRFEGGSARLVPESQPKLENVAAILEAYPTVEVKVGATADDVGDPIGDQKLSQQRAEQVRRELIGLGVAPRRVSAEGYGDQHPDGQDVEADAEVSLKVSAR